MSHFTQPPFGTLDGTGIEKFDARFNRLVPGPEKVERLWTGARWCEGPAWFGAHRTLVWSSIGMKTLPRNDISARPGPSTCMAFSPGTR